MQIKYSRDITRVHTGKAPKMSVLVAAYGRNVAESWLEIQLNDLSEFAGCKEKLTPRQINETAQMILEAYPHYNLTEVMLFIQRFKRCQYGRFYGAVDPMIILQALSRFDEERRDYLLKLYDEERNAERRRQQQEADEVRRRYLARVPDANTDRAPLTLVQYRLMGYDTLSDRQLAAEIAALRNGAKKIPREAMEIIGLLKETHQIQNR